MTKFPAYGMAGVGIAAATGFVFALSLFANHANYDADSDSIQRQQQWEQSVTQPSSLLFVQQQQHNTEDGIASDDDVYGGSPDTAATSTPSIENGTAFEGEEDASQMMMMTQKPEEAASLSSSSLRPTLVTIIVSDASTGEMIGEVMPNMQFEAGRPVFIKAHLANLNSLQISGNVVALGISSSDNSDDDEGIRTGSELESENSNRMLTQRQAYEQASSFRGDISAGQSIELELYWNPVRAGGEYKLLLFSITPDELASSPSSEELTVVAIAPIASIPIKVTEPAR